MGYAYYGHYAEFFEVARVEFLRKAGLSYKELEERGFLLPVYSYNVKFYKPAFYDDVITVEVKLTEVKASRLVFGYKTFNQDGIQLNEAQTTLVMVSKENGKPTRIPVFFRKLIFGE